MPCQTSRVFVNWVSVHFILQLLSSSSYCIFVCRLALQDTLKDCGRLENYPADDDDEYSRGQIFI